MLDAITPKPYVAHQKMFDAAYPHGRHYYWKAHKLGPLTDEIIDIIVDHATQVTSPLSAIPIFCFGGAAARVPEESTAFPYRDASHDLNIVASWLPKRPPTPTATSNGCAGSSLRWSPTAAASM